MNSNLWLHGCVAEQREAHPIQKQAWGLTRKYEKPAPPALKRDLESLRDKWGKKGERAFCLPSLTSYHSKADKEMSEGP